MLFLFVKQLFIGDCRGWSGEVYKKLNNFPAKLSTGFSIFMPDQGHRMKMGEKEVWHAYCYIINVISSLLSPGKAGSSSVGPAFSVVDHRNHPRHG
jgi:hypothetical protein